jgi:hypothetical protein
MDGHGHIWAYDGRKNNGIPWRDRDCPSTNGNIEMDSLTILDGRSAYLYIYALVTD